MTRRILITMAAVVLVLGFAWYVSRQFFAGPPQTDATPVPAAVVETALVVAVDGEVHTLQDDGTWRPLKAGDTVHEKTTLRTKTDSSAVVDLGRDATVTLAQDTLANLDEISETLSKVRVDEGRLSATVSGGVESQLEVRVANSDAVAVTESGDFSVLTDGSGALSVATRKGTVKLSGAGATVSVGEGQQSHVQVNEQPSQPAEIPASLLLRVNAPARRTQRSKAVVIRGEATPGTIVDVNGEQMGVGDDGAFSVRISLAEGKNKVRVGVEDATGRKKEQELPSITVDSKAPEMDTDVTWD